MIKTFHFDRQFDYGLLILFDAWLDLSALLDSSTSILEEGGLDVAAVKEAINRGDRAFVALLREDRGKERLS